MGPGDGIERKKEREREKWGEKEERAYTIYYCQPHSQVSHWSGNGTTQSARCIMLGGLYCMSIFPIMGM